MNEMPIWQLTVSQLVSILKDELRFGGNVDFHETIPPSHTYVYGIRGIAEIFGCSTATAQRIKDSGILDDAITQVGRKIIVDADKALLVAAARKELKYHD